MKAHITVTMENAAFEDNGHAHELARILRELASRLERADLPAKGVRHLLRDSNGNTVGKLAITG